MDDPRELEERRRKQQAEQHNQIPFVHNQDQYRSVPIEGVQHRAKVEHPKAGDA